MNETLLLTNLIAGMVLTPAPYYPPSAILHTLPYTEIVPGPGINVCGDSGVASLRVDSNAAGPASRLEAMK